MKIKVYLCSLLVFAGCGDDDSPAGDVAPDSAADSNVLDSGQDALLTDALVDAAHQDAVEDAEPLAPAERLVSASTASGNTIELRFDGAVSLSASAAETLRFYGTTSLAPTSLQQPTPSTVVATLPNDAVYGEVITVSYERESGGLGAVDGFRRAFVDNTLPYQGGASGNGRDIWVAPDASGNGDGSQQAPYAVSQLSSSTLRAGDRVNIQAGTYRRTLPMTVAGTPGNPVIYEGYRVSPGDVRPTSYPEAFADLDPAEMPLFEGTSRSSGTAINLDGAAREHIVLRNLQIRHWEKGINAWGAASPSRAPLRHVVLDNIAIDDLGTDTAPGIGIHLVYGDRSYHPHDLQVVNTYVANCTAANVRVDGNDSFIFRSRSYSDDSRSHAWDTDYMFVAYAGDNIVWRELYTEKGENPGHAGHGFTLKSLSYGRIHNALIEDCEARNINGAVEFRHENVRHSVARRVRMVGMPHSENSSGVQFRDGASFNVLEQSWITDTTDTWYGLVSFMDSAEEGFGQLLEGNIVRNNVFVSSRNYSAYFRFGGSINSSETFEARGNQIVNNTLVGGSYWLRYADAVTVNGTVFANNLVVDTNGAVFGGDAAVGVESDNNCFFNSNFVHGTAVSEDDPAFVDASSRNYHLRPTSPAADSGKDIEGVSTDMDGVPRVNGRYSIGAYEIDP